VSEAIEAMVARTLLNCIFATVTSLWLAVRLQK
jgi:hypothetical protein